MSTLTQFTVTGKEKDDFYAFGIHSDTTSQTINRTITKDITGVNKNDSIYQYNLTTAFDATTAVYQTTTSLVRNGSETQTDGNYTTAQKGLSDIKGISFNNNGTKMYAVDKYHARVIQYALSSAYTITSLTYEKEKSIKTEGIGPVAMTFNNDGTKMFVIENSGSAFETSPTIAAGNINEYALSGAYDVATATFTRRLSIVSEDANAVDLKFNKVARGAVNPGELLFVLGDDGNDINEYLLTTAYDLSTASFVDAFSVAAQDDKVRALAFDDDGDKVYTVGGTGNEINQYPLVTGYDISTTQAVTSTATFRTNNIEPRGFSFSADGTKMFVVGIGGTLIVDGGDDEDTITHIVRPRNTLKLLEGNTYVFNVSDSNLTQSDFKFSTTEGGTKSGGAEYTTGVTTSGTIGTADATVTIVMPEKAQSLVGGSAIGELYYYESDFTNTGGKAFTPQIKGILQITKTNGVDDIETRAETKNQEDLFVNSFFMRAGLTFSVDNGDLKVELN